MTTQARILEGATSPARSWVELLRANCITLQTSAAVNAVSVSRAFAHGDEDARESVIVLAQRMAEEYGLLSEVELRGHYLTLRFSRMARADAESRSDGLSLANRVRSLLRFGRKAEGNPQPVTDAAEAATEVRP